MRTIAARYLLLAISTAHAARAQDIAVPRAGKLELTALLEKLDPGPQATLSSLLAPATVEEARRTATAADRALLAAEALLEPEAVGAFFRRLELERLAFLPGTWRQVIRWIVLLEDAHAGAAGPNARQADLLFGLYRRLVAARTNQRLAERIVAAVGAEPEEPAVQEYLRGVKALVGDASRSADLRARRVAVELLRGRAGAKVRAVALRYAAGSLSGAEDPEPSLLLLEEAARLDQDSMDADEWRRLGHAYCSCLLIEPATACAERAQGPFGAGKPRATAEETRRLTRRIEIASEVKRLGAKASVAHELAVSHLLLDLGLLARARAAFSRLAADHGDDARPRLGLARAAYEQLDDAAARLELDLATKLEPKDLRHHSLALCLALAELPLALARADQKGNPTATFTLARDLVAPLAPLLASTKEASDPQTLQARAVAELAGAALAGEQVQGDAMCTKAFTGRHAELRALVRRFPDAPGCAALLRSAALFATNAAEAVEDLSSLPPGPAAVEAWLAVAARYDRAECAERVETLVAPPERRTGSDWHALGTAQALLARLRAEPKRWTTARTCFERALAEALSDERGRFANDLGVALFELGDVAGARALLERTYQRGGTQLSRVNAVLSAKGDEPSREDLAHLLVDREDDRPGPLFPEALVHAWLSVRADARGEKDEAQREARKAAELAAAQPQERGLGKAGVCIERSVHWGFRSRPHELRELDARIDKLVWLTIPPPPKRN